MAETTAVGGSQGAEPQPRTSSLLIWDPRWGPGFILAVAALVIGFSCIAPKVYRRINRVGDGVQGLLKGQQRLRENQRVLQERVGRLEKNQEQIIEKVDAILEAVGEE